MEPFHLVQVLISGVLTSVHNQSSFVLGVCVISCVFTRCVQQKDVYERADLQPRGVAADGIMWNPSLLHKDILIYQCRVKPSVGEAWETDSDAAPMFWCAWSCSTPQPRGWSWTRTLCFTSALGSPFKNTLEQRSSRYCVKRSLIHDHWNAFLVLLPGRWTNLRVLRHCWGDDRTRQVKIGLSHNPPHSWI